MFVSGTFLLCACASGCTDQSGELPTGAAGPSPASLDVLSKDGLVAPPNLADVYAKVDESRDDWDTEASNAAVGARLKLLASRFETGALTELEAVAAADYEGSALRPSDLQEIYRDESLVVLRAEPAAGSTPRRGSSGLVRSFESLRAPFTDSGEVDLELHVSHIEDEGDLIRTAVHANTFGRTTDGLVQQNMEWLCEWSRAGVELLLTGITVTRYEEVAHLGGETWFADCTEAVLGGNASFSEQILPSIDHWRGNLDAGLGISVAGHQGIAIGDANGDGLDDLYACQPGGLPNLLFLRQPDGTAVDASRASGADVLEESRGALLVDLDDDADQDLVVQTISHTLVMANVGNAEFAVRYVARTPMATTVAAADYDDDGRLDLYVCCYSSPTMEKPPVPYHDANNGHANFLLRGKGDLQFEEVTGAVGLDRNNRRYSFAAAWEDYDDDGDQDLYVANDFGRNNLYRNDGGRFTDVAATAGVEDISAGMGVSWGDWDADGDMDLYVSNMHSNAGGRVAYQTRFHLGADHETLQAFRRHARGNSLFSNNGDGTFTDVSEDAAVTMGRWAWGAIFVDLNNDGREDILVPNGFITNEDTKDL
jgi:hypothetical protein